MFINLEIYTKEKNHIIDFYNDIEETKHHEVLTSIRSNMLGIIFQLNNIEELKLICVKGGKNNNEQYLKHINTRKKGENKQE